MSKAEGKKIVINFTLPLIGDVSGNEDAFTVTGQEYQWLDGPDHNGPIINKGYTVDSVERYGAAVVHSDTFDGTINGLELSVEGLVLGVNI